MAFSDNRGLRPGLAVLAVPCAALFSPFTCAEQGDWLVRLRGVVVATADESDEIDLAAGGVSTPLAGSGVNVDSSVIPELDVTYMLHRNWGVEVIAGIANHDVSLDGPGATLAGLGFTDDFKIFDSWVLPPTVTVQYHFLPDGKIRPYVGAGINYTAFLWNDATSALEAAVGPVDVDMDNSWNWAAQAGVDIDLSGGWYFNLDVKYIDVEGTASLLIKNGPLGGSSLRVDVDVDPFLAGAGIGYRF
jgi:outer membrane protein